VSIATVGITAMRDRNFMVFRTPLLMFRVVLATPP